MALHTGIHTAFAAFSYIGKAMNKKMIEPMVGTLVACLLGALVAWAGSQGSVVWLNNWSLFACCVAFAFVVNWLVFIPSFLAHTEHFFDLTGSLTYLSVLAFGLAYGPSDPRAVLIAVLVAIWAMRLGSFLFSRVRAAGSDSRFDKMKHMFLQFLMTWTLQGLWVSFTLAAGLVALTTATPKPLDWACALGLLVWIAGFSIEVIADRQKTQFKADPANEGRFISTGLWSWSRHPNYLGEIVLWAGVAIIALPVMQGWQLIGLISPLFVFVLLTYVSGVRLLENQGKRRWGNDPAYQEYVANTPVLLLSKPKPLS